jgi:hypothetical protein
VQRVSDNRAALSTKTLDPVREVGGLARFEIVPLALPWVPKCGFPDSTFPRINNLQP